MADGEPAEKKQKLEAEGEAEAEAKEVKEVKEPPKAPEPPKELEEDAPKDSAPKIKDTVTFLTSDTTMNVLPSTVGNILMPLSDGSLSHLVACARANVGIKSGRYLFEAKIVEQTQRNADVRVGFSAEGSLYLGEDDNSVCFDNSGFMIAGKKKTKNSAPFGRDIIVAVLLNLDAKTENANTISLFRDGKRVSQPQALPENLKGKTLFPAISFKSATVHLNFAAPAVALPFTCKAVQEATAKDAEVKKGAAPSDGKHTVLFPISLPDEGTFDWLDDFLEKNPDYTEISDRAFGDWAFKSGVSARGRKESNDKPNMGGLDDMANVKRTCLDLVALQPRNLVVMEVKGNLLKDAREKALETFKSSSFKTVAEVMSGAPAAAFHKIVEAKVLKAKQMQSDQEHRGKFLIEKREWAVRKKTKEAEKMKKKAEKERKKKEEELKKTREKATKKAAYEMAKKKAEVEGKDPPPEPEEEEEEEKEAEPEPEEEEPEEPEEPEPVETDGPKVTLTAEEKATKFFTHTVKDLTEKDLALSFTKFTLPESDEFGSVKYSWSKEKDAKEYLRKWVLDRKLTTRVEDIVPSPWFRQKLAAWVSENGRLKNKQNEFKAMLSKKAAEKQARAAKKAAAEKKRLFEAERAKRAAEEKAKKEAELAEKKAAALAAAAEAGEGEEKKEEAEEAKEEEKEEAKEEPKEEPKVEEVVEEEPEEEEEPPIDLDTIEVFGTEDIMDVGTQYSHKTPLFRDFNFEDWALLSLRFELHVLVHSFSKDCTDPDRKGIPVDHLSFYYQKYFGKNLAFGQYGVQTAAELIALVNDTIIIKDSVLASLVPGELETNTVFAKITEAARRERLLQIDMGTEGARLKIKGDHGNNRDHQGAAKGGDFNKGDAKGGWGNWVAGKDAGFGGGLGGCGGGGGGGWGQGGGGGNWGKGGKGGGGKGKGAWGK